VSPVMLARTGGEEAPVRHRALRARAHGATDPGIVRQENQDAFSILEPSDATARSQKGLLLVVADGMGGLSGGATASHIAIEAIRESYRDADPGLNPGLALKAAVHRANLLIHAHSEGLPEQEPMGSTVTALAVIEDRAYVAHVGDSRAYRLSERGPIRRLTKDHTWVEELAKRGELDPGSLQYSLHRNVLTRGLGLREAVEVDVVEIGDVAPGDTFLLCSDGLHEMVEDVEIEARLRARGADLRAAAADLIGLARDRGGPDNITVIMARTEALDPVEAPRLAPEREEGGGRGPAPAPAALRLFPRAALISFSWFAAFALGVGTVLLLEEPPRPLPDPLERILEDPTNRPFFSSPEGARAREALDAYRRRRAASEPR
jgi:serine/threonine protein phosphatase PrpC